MSAALASEALRLAMLPAGYLGCRLLLPQVVAVATRRGWMDHPGERRAHTEAVPRLGGVAIAASVAMTVAAAAMAATLPGAGGISALLGTVSPALLVGCALVFGVGLVDDVVGVSPRTKLLAQGMAAVAVMAAGFHPDTLAIAPGGLTLALDPAVAAVLTLLWVVGVTNAFNLIDGIDGLAGTMALLAIGLGLVSAQLLTSGSFDGVSLAFAGALVAFLRSNWHPARIFLGDAGSMTLGFFLAVRTVQGATDSQGVTFPVLPLAALAYPLADTFVAMARRWVRGHSFSRADGRHIHHQILALGFRAPRAVQLLATLFGGVAFIGVAIVFAPGRLVAAVTLAGGVLLFAVAVYGVRWLGYVEFLEVGSSIASVVRNARTVVNEKLRAAEIAERIRGAESLEEVRTLLETLAEETRLLDVELLVLDGRERRLGPPSQQLSPPDALPVRLEYPIAWQAADGTQEVLLRVWSARPAPGSHPAAERVANRIGPALDEWFRTHDRKGAVAVPVFKATER